MTTVTRTRWLPSGAAAPRFLPAPTDRRPLPLSGHARTRRQVGARRGNGSEAISALAVPETVGIRSPYPTHPSSFSSFAKKLYLPLGGHLNREGQEGSCEYSPHRALARC